MLAGVLAGSGVAHRVDGRSLSLVFGGVALLVALHMAFGRESWTVRESLPEGAPRYALGGLIGFVSVLDGSRRRHARRADLQRLRRADPPRGRHRRGPGPRDRHCPAASPSRGRAGASPGRPPGSAGFVNLLGLAAITPATWLAAPLGARLAHALPRVWLRRAFALFLALTAARMLGALRG